jgi:putative spermidine/putrescine transport system substrate-binding protein
MSPASEIGPQGETPMAKKNARIAGGWTRRRFGKHMMAAGAAALGLPMLAGRVARGQGAGLERELVFSARGGSLGTVFRTKIIPPFEARFNCKVTMVTNDSNPALAKVVAEKANPQTDVLWTVEPTHANGLLQGVLEKFDLDRVPNYKKLHAFAQLPNATGVGWGIGATIIGYNAKIYEQRKIAPPKAWGDLITPETAKRVAWLDLSTQQGLNTFLMANRAQGGKDDNVDPIFRYLKANLDKVTLISSPAQVDDLLQQSAAWIATNIDARMAILKSKGFPLGLTYPSDGLPIQSAMLDLIKGAPHPNLAHEFVNWVLSDEMQMIIANDIKLGPTNKTVKLEPDVAAGLIYGEERVSRVLTFDSMAIARAMPSWLDRWNRELT